VNSYRALGGLDTRGHEKRHPSSVFIVHTHQVRDASRETAKQIDCYAIVAVSASTVVCNLIVAEHQESSNGSQYFPQRVIVLRDLLLSRG
jgi:hypothetical protein